MAFEERLRTALEDAVKFCNEGSTPDEAVCKTASAHGFNRDQTDRLVETLNTAITLNQYKHAADKTKPFPVAHKEKVASMMLDADSVIGKKEKKASAHLYFEYMKPAHDYVKHADDVAEKAASAEKDTDTSGLTFDNLAYLSLKKMRLVKDAGAFAGNVAGQIKGDLVTQLYSLADSIKKGGEERYGRFKVACTHEEIVKNLNKVLPPKFAEVVCKKNLVDDSDLTEELKLAEDMHENYVAMQDMREQEKSLKKQAAQMTEEINSAFAGVEKDDSFLGLFKSADAKDDTIAALKKKVEKLNKALEEKKKAEPPNALNRLAFGKGIIGDTKGLSHSGLFDIDNVLMFDDKTKENDEAKRTEENVRRSMMLQELMAKDPIIREADPEVVASTYNTLLQTAPKTASNQEVVRSVLRQAINSIAVSPYDASTWADLEKKQREAAKILV